MIKKLFYLLFFFPTILLAAPAEEEVSANEDLMREHGVLSRLLLIYQEIASRIENFQEFPIESLSDSVSLIRSFVEDYHEKLEEEYIFPQFENAGKLTYLVKILRSQHEAGRHITDYILSHAKESMLKDEIERLILADYIKLYIRMYRPHESREDTVLFPAFRKLVSQEKYKELGELFEEKEHQLFGDDGFDKIVNAISRIEQSLGIYNLAQFTPRVPSS